MKAHGRSAILIVVGIAAAVLLSFLAVHWVSQPSVPPNVAGEMGQEPSEASLPPSLDCAFHNFTRTAAVVSFYFDVELPKSETPRFYERAMLLADGTRKYFTANDRPAWTYGLDGDGKPTITSSDGATRIVLYGLKLGTAGVVPVEAGIRSNVYRNLGGECRQTNLGAAIGVQRPDVLATKILEFLVASPPGEVKIAMGPTLLRRRLLRRSTPPVDLNCPLLDRS